jgi:hypothetical protein
MKSNNNAITVLAWVIFLNKYYYIVLQLLSSGIAIFSIYCSNKLIVSSDESNLQILSALVAHWLCMILQYRF